MKRPGKKLLSLVVSLGMIFSLFGGTGLTGLAAETDGTESASYTAAAETDAAESASCSVTFVLTNLTSSAGESDTAEYGVDYDVELSVEDPLLYSLPESVSVAVSGEELVADDEYTYETTSGTGVLIIAADYVTGDIVITADATANYAASVYDGSSTTGYDTVGDAFDAANALSAASAITLLQDCEVSETLTTDSGSDITLDLAGHVLSGAEDASALSVLTVNGTLTIDDSSDEGSGIVTGGNVRYGAGAYVYAGGSLTLENGSISGNDGTGTSSSSQGGGIYTAGDFVMNGGSVSGNTSGMYGGGVCVTSDGSFTMNGGSVSENNSLGSYGYGGGVYTAGDFVMNGGTVSGNSATNNGGGVYVYKADFDLNDGSISDNAVITTTASWGAGGGVYLYGAAMTMEEATYISGNTANYAGGGVCVSNTSTLTMNGGSISGNTVSSSTSSVYGGGVYMPNSNYLYMYGGEITGNSVETTLSGGTAAGGGVYSAMSYLSNAPALTVSGESVISGNTAGGVTNNYQYVDSTVVIRLGTGGLEDGSDIGVTVADTIYPWSGEVAVTVTESSTGYYKTAYEYFTSDEGYSVCASSSGYVAFYVPSDTYSVSWSLTNLSTSNTAETTTNAQNYKAVLYAESSSYEIPETISVKVGGVTLDASAYTYDVSTGTITIPASEITGDIVITATAVAIQETPDQDEDGCYILDSEEDVLWLEDRAGRGAEYDAVLAADITMSDTFAGIGTSDYPYTGILDGAGHTITLEITSDDAAGLVAYADGASIRDLTVAGSVISTSTVGAGGFVGSVGSGGVTVEDCVNQAAVQGTNSVGGIVGAAIDGGEAAIAGCSNEGTVSGTKNYCGGIIGCAYTADISDSANYGTVSSSDSYAGGIAGYSLTQNSYAYGVTITDCFNYGEVSASSYAAGIIAYAKTQSANAHAVTETRCGNEGTVSADGSGYAGGIVAYCFGSNVTGDSLYNAGSVSATRYAGGIAGYTDSSSSLSNVYNTGTVTSTATNNSNSYVGGIIGRNNSYYSTLKNAYNAGVVAASKSTATSFGRIVGWTISSVYLRVDNVYYLSTLEVPDTNTYGDAYLYSISAGAFLTDEEKAAMGMTAEELTAMATTLGESFKDNENSDYHGGYPVLSWEDVPEPEEELAITSQPEDYTGAAGETAVFEVEATGSGLSYQWQYSSNGGITWHDSGMDGAGTAVISVPVTSARDGQRYRCVVTDQNGDSVTSDAATLSLPADAFTITLQPEDYTGLSGSTAVFTVEADGTSLSYQWQYSGNGGTTWHDSSLSGADTATLSVTLTESRDGQQYRCVVTDEDGNSVTSDAAAMNLASGGGIVINTQPSDYAGTLGDKASFTVEAEGDTALSYQWQYSSNSGTTWHDSGMDGADTATVSVYLTSARDGQQYRCVITDDDGNMTVSDAAALSISAETADMSTVSAAALSVSGESDGDDDSVTETEFSQLLCAASGETALTVYSSTASVSAAVTSSETYIRGDVDDNGAVDEEDVTTLKRYVAGIGVTVNAYASDINADDSINMIDVVLLERYVAGVGTNTWGIGDEFTPEVSVESLTLSQTEAELALGGVLQLTAEISPEDAADTDVVWSSSDTNLATVSDSGVVIASSSNYGIVVITAQAGDCEAQCTVYVGNRVIFYGDQDEMEVTVSSSKGTCEIYEYDGGSSSDYESAYVACLPDGSYSYTATADGYYASVCAFTVDESGSVSYTTGWDSTVLQQYGLDEMLDGSNAAFYLDLEEFVQSPSVDDGAWDGVTLDVSWYTPGAGTYYISTPEQLAGLAAIVNGIYNAEVTKIIDSTGEYTPEEYASYTGRKIDAGCSSSNGTSGSGYNEVTSTDYYYSGLGYDFDGETIYLTADLDMGGYQDEDGNWTGAWYMPIGGQYQMHYVKNEIGDGFSHIGASFNGTFDGQGHIVYNIYCDRYSETAYGDSSTVGLIGRLGNHDNDYDSYKAYGNDGGNYPAVSPTVRNVAVDGWIYARRSVGGIVGKTGKTAYNYTGSISAYADVTDGAIIENCVNFATVTSTDAKGCGGIVGAGWNGGTISNCANFGDITNVKYATCPVGGISGSNENKIINCYNVGIITAMYESFAEGIGTNNGGGTDIQNCYWLTGTATEGYYKGGSSITVYEVTDNFNDTELEAADYMVSEYLADDLNGSTGRVWVMPEETDSIYAYLSEAGYTGAAVPRIFTSQTAEVTEIEVTGSPEKLNYVAGETFDTTGLVIRVYWSDDTSELVEPELSIEGALATTDTEITLSVEAGSLSWSETYDIQVIEYEVSSMSVSTQPTTRTYNEGDYFDPTGLKVTITYSNGKTVTAAWQEGNTFLDTSDSGEEYTIIIRAESPLTYEGSNGVGVTLSYTYEWTTVTAVTNVLTIVQSSGEPEQDDDGIYQVGTADELDWVASQVNSGLGQSMSVCLTDDITANSDYTPIGSSSYPFQGNFDGSGHTVTLAIDSDDANQALFAYTGEGAAVENVIVDGSVSGSSYVAGLIAYVSGDTVVKNCGNLADITVSGAKAGGLVAYVYKSGVTIQNCFNRGSVTETGTTQSAYGGIVGEVYNSDAAISGCYNQGAVSGYAGKSTMSRGIGGIVGANYNSATSTSVTDSYNAGMLTNYDETTTSTLNPEMFVGAIIGVDRSSKAVTDNCYWLKGTASYDLGYQKTTTGETDLDTLIGCAAVLGDAYQSNDGCLPILTWQTVTGHVTDDDGVCIYCGTEVSD